MNGPHVVEAEYDGYCSGVGGGGPRMAAAGATLWLEAGSGATNAEYAFTCVCPEVAEDRSQGVSGIIRGSRRS